ncbi:hypothetical protein [Paenibacillus tundrae]|uniref:Uncharacterized protein n=1 Tax=Paenibacillus tundrae TaxID=528187 RepID=A0ABT9WGG5_9BACL|nr:hypothetical protein [Paenibacillus tundrae]MDQ0172144.1 hypothetical protein [Paenibacillus tundrae]
MKAKRNQWRKWQASAAATLVVAALFQYVRSSDAFDVAYASANGTDTSNTINSEVATRDDVIDEWDNSRTNSSSPSLQYNQDYGNNQSRGGGDGSSGLAPYSNYSRTAPSGNSTDKQNQQNDSRTFSGSYQSRTGAS